MRTSVTPSTPGHRTWSTSSPARSTRRARAAASPAVSRVGASNHTHRAPTSRAGRPYRSVAQALVARGLLPDDHTTLPDVRHALEALSPAEQAAVLATDERYTFF